MSFEPGQSNREAREEISDLPLGMDGMVHD